MRRGYLHLFRRAVQIGIILLFAVVPLINRTGTDVLSGNFFFFSIAGIPAADPLSALQVALGAFSVTTSLCAGAGLALLLALLMGPVFCGWFCPYGFFSELARGMALRCGRVVQRPRPPLFAAKALIVCAGLLGVLFYAPMPLLNQLSMPGWYSRAMQHAAFYGEALPGALILFPSLLVTEILSGWRFWCLGLCPQSVLIALAGAVLPGRLHVRFNGTFCTCTGPERPCRKQCSLDLDPRAEYRRRRLQCGNCGDCIDVCRKKGGALRFAFGKKA